MKPGHKGSREWAAALVQRTGRPVVESNAPFHAA